jgi:hypothetical protein
VIDGSTPEGAERWINSLKVAARHTFRTTGEIQPHAFLLARVNPKTGVRLLYPEPFAVLCSFEQYTDSVKKAFVNLLRKQALALDAVGVAFLQEMWGSWDFPKRLQAKLKKHLEAGGKLENFEERREYVTIILEHGALGQRVYHARIGRDDDGVTLGEWRKLDGNIWEGKYMNVLPAKAYGATGPIGHA